jgi:hypothetical protein
LFLARSLAASGDAVRARTVASDGAKRFKGTDLAPDFSAMLQ